MLTFQISFTFGFVVWYLVIDRGERATLSSMLGRVGRLGRLVPREAE